MQVRKLTISIIILVVAILGVFGVAYFIQQTPSAENNEPVSQEEIDTSGWKTYWNEEFGFEFQYPENLNLCEWDKFGSFNVVISNYFEEDCSNLYTEDDLSFKIAVQPSFLGKNYGWKIIASDGRDTIGEVIEHGFVSLNNLEIYKLVAEGRGYLEEYKNTHLSTTIVLPNNTQDRLNEYTLVTKKINNTTDILILESIVLSTVWFK